jgi:hypothetical protein
VLCNKFICCGLFFGVQHTQFRIKVLWIPQTSIMCSSSVQKKEK